MKPRVFIGSSVEALPISYACQTNLRFAAEVTVWDQGIFRLSQTALESLTAALGTFDFAVFIFSPDDLAVIRNEEHRVVRDNVVFELGMFIGKLGSTRCFILTPDGDDELHLPTDLLGIKPATYDRERRDNNWSAATAPACNDIRGELRQQGLRTVHPVESAVGTPPTPERESNEIPTAGVEPASDSQEIKSAVPVHEPWITALLDNRAEDALTAVVSAIESETDPKKLSNLRLWQAFILFEISPQQGEDAYRSLAREDPGNPTPWVQLCSALIGAGFTDRALAVAEEALEALPNSAEVGIVRAKSLEALNRAAEAEEYLLGRAQALPAAAEAIYSQIARIQAESGNTNACLETLKKARIEFPYSIELLERLAYTLANTSAHAETVLAFRQLLQLRPKEPSYHAMMGNALLGLDLSGMAFDAYRAANRLAEQRAGWIVANIGNLLNNRGLYGYAVEQLEIAAKLEPHSEYAQERLLWARRNRGAEQQRLETSITDARRNAADGTDSGGNA